ncbi:lysylphosphatidylglycerol synthase domain-containing protein [Nocardiopsis ansamitocini]|uniref:Membrane protein n=1 Tax=Nocardiopsis ansamitocini TaxID=1670832 RepID=A0A9W6P9U8_9ACTN|nr:lysylphosphatidylglycerol synthase domain-containing protein [Nocardiopsis ansamitocini]GLU49627.1 membrane protein [Nocardiopsis ansamitocini]
MLSRLRANPWVRTGIVLLVLGCAGLALYARWDEASQALAALPTWVIAGSLVAALAGLGAQMLAWRALLGDLGSPLPLPVAARVMFVGQLGKYLPGSVWAFVAQVELAKDYAVPRRRGVSATVLAVGVTLTVNLLVAAVTLPLASAEAAARWWWVLACAPVLLAALHPRVVTWLLHRVLRLTGRGKDVPESELERISGRGMAAAVGWSALSWIPLGLHVWTLVAGVGGGGAESLPVAAGAYALAWTLGLLVVFAPAGLGVRELVLVVALAPVLAPGAALVVAALSRVVMTAADILWALTALATTRSPARPRP